MILWNAALTVAVCLLAYRELVQKPREEVETQINARLSGVHDDWDFK